MDRGFLCGLVLGILCVGMGCSRKVFVGGDRGLDRGWRLKSSLRYASSGKDTLRLRGDIRVWQDSLLWFSVSKLGFEALRVRYTPTHVSWIDRLRKNFRVYTSSEWRSFMDSEGILCAHRIFLYGRHFYWVYCLPIPIRRRNAAIH